MNLRSRPWDAPQSNLRAFIFLCGLRVLRVSWVHGRVYKFIDIIGSVLLDPPLLLHFFVLLVSFVVPPGFLCVLRGSVV